jgi:hypothetical protein
MGIGMVWYQICQVIASLRYSERVIALYRVGITVRYNASNYLFCNFHEVNNFFILASKRLIRLKMSLMNSFSLFLLVKHLKKRGKKLMSRRYSGFYSELAITL